MHWNSPSNVGNWKAFETCTELITFWNSKNSIDWRGSTSVKHFCVQMPISN